MLADSFTKHVQGSKFKLFRRDDVATLWDDSNDKYKTSSTSKERVEDTGNNLDVYD